MLLNRQIVTRVWNSAVLWTWIFNGLRLASGILLLPLVVKYLPKEDFGMYFLFLFLYALGPVLDSVISVTVARNVGYAMSGVKELRSFGVVVAEEKRGPNTELLGQLLVACRYAYGILSVTIFIFLFTAGYFAVRGLVPTTASPSLTWIAWGLLVLSAPLEVYTSSKLAFLRGMNKVLLTSRLSVLVYALKLGLSCLFLLAGLKLLGIALAGNLAAVVQRLLANHFARKILPSVAEVDRSSIKNLWRVMWPNTWRVALVVISAWLPAVVFASIISNFFGLAQNAKYSLSFQLLCSIAVGIAATWTAVKWPMVNQLRAAGDSSGLKRLLLPRLGLQMGTYVLLVLLVVFIGPGLLSWWSGDKEMLPQPWLIMLGLYGLLEMNYAFWTTLLSTENRVPSLWAAVVTNLAGITLSLVLLNHTTLNLGAFVLGPLICGLLFNYWFWPIVGARSMGTTWSKVMFGSRTAHP